MKVGIVGCEAAKFTPYTQAEAREAIRELIVGAELVISGQSPLGGIDWWAIEEAEAAGIPTQEFPPRNLSWGLPGGYRERNLKIARASDLVACIVPRVLPHGYKGMRFPRGCYHCNTPPEDHVKSGGCWTMREAKRMGKDTELVVIEPQSARLVKA